jgi:solute:Na+ symporter, SSS family
VWILQTLPAVFLALFTRWLNRWAVLAGWCAGMAWGTYMLAHNHFAGSTYDVGGLGAHWTWYIGLFAVLANVLVVLAGTGLAVALGWRPAPGIAEIEFEEPVEPHREAAPLELEPRASQGV